MYCNIYQSVRYAELSQKNIEDIVNTVLAGLKMKNKEVSVHLIGDTQMKKMNRLYRGQNKTTDVLSFAMQEGKKISESDLGDIFISVPQVKKQAKERNISAKEEFVRMMVHGVLHLCGFDHVTKKEEKEMFSLQEKMVKRFVYEF